MSQPEIALLMSTYQRPWHLSRALESIALQQGVTNKIELVVTDDGSTDETPRLVEDFARRADFPVAFTTHPHTTFQLARSRNEGVRASSAPYLLFLDGDCVLPPDHVHVHLERRSAGVVMAGDCCRLEEGESAGVTSETIRAGTLAELAPAAEMVRLRKLDRTSRYYQFIRHPTKPKLFGNNVGIWRSDYERVNGYDENFQGWGCEDDDLRYRLRQAGVRIESILRFTRTYHLWHPLDVTAPVAWNKGLNVDYLRRRGRLTRCINGLRKRRLDELSIRIVNSSGTGPAGWLPRLARDRAEPVEVEVLFLPGSGRFSGRAECNVLVASESDAAASPAARKCHVRIAPQVWARSTRAPAFPRVNFEQALGLVA